MLVLAMEFSRGEPRERKARRGEQAAGRRRHCRRSDAPGKRNRGVRFGERLVQETKVFHRKGRPRNRIASDQLGVLGCNDPSRNSLERR